MRWLDVLRTPALPAAVPSFADEPAGSIAVRCALGMSIGFMRPLRQPRLRALPHDEAFPAASLISAYILYGCRFSERLERPKGRGVNTK